MEPEISAGIRRAVVAVDGGAQLEALNACLAKNDFRIERIGPGGSYLELLNTDPPDILAVDGAGLDGEALEEAVAACELKGIDLLVLHADKRLTAAVGRRPVFFRSLLEKDLPTEEVMRRVRRLVDFRLERLAFPIIGHDSGFLTILKVVDRIAPTDIPILITGESGTGKEVIARLIHFQSRRWDRPFIEVNSGAIPDNLLEAELFGYERGAFTDAKIRKKGLFELAEGGTVFLDEIGSLPPHLQAKILRAIEIGKFRHLGGTEELQVSLRVIAATNTDLDSAIRDGTFREDLYHRLSVAHLKLPPLRDRPEDIPILADHLLNRFRWEYETPLLRFHPTARRAMLEYGWSGNVRELKNKIERATLMAETSVIGLEDLGLPASLIQGEPSRTPSVKTTENGISIQSTEKGISLQRVEEELIRLALVKSGWNVSRAARFLDLGRDQLRYRMSKYGISPPEK